MYFTSERNESLAKRLFEHVRNGTTDQAEGLVDYELAIYSDPAVAAQERERIFQRLPMMAVHSAQIAEPGQFVTLQLNRSNVIVSRQEDGSVKALVNACRHRGSTLVKQESGKRSRFTCPYHGWTYASDGRLKAIAFNDTFGPGPSEERSLVSLPVEERHGFIWIVENPEGSINVAAHLGPGMDKLLEEYHLERYSCYRSEVFEFDQNWKIMVDGVIDGYHVSFVHGATIKPYFYLNMMVLEDHGNHLLSATPRRTIDTILHEEPGASALDRYAVFGNLVSPNTAFVLHPHHIEHWTVYQHPKDPGKCRVHLRYLTPEKEYDADGHARLEKNWQIATAAIINEDVPVGNSIQASASFPYTGTVTLGLNEVGNQLFRRAYRRYMAA